MLVGGVAMKTTPCCMRLEENFITILCTSVIVIKSRSQQLINTGKSPIRVHDATCSNLNIFQSGEL